MTATSSIMIESISACKNNEEERNLHNSNTGERAGDENIDNDNDNDNNNNNIPVDKRKELERLFGQWVLVEQQTKNSIRSSVSPQAQIHLRQPQRFNGDHDHDTSAKNDSVYFCCASYNTRRLGFIPPRSEHVAVGGFVTSSGKKNNVNDDDDVDEKNVWLEMVGYDANKPHQGQVLKKIECYGEGQFRVTVTPCPANTRQRATSTSSNVMSFRWELNSTGTKLTVSLDKNTTDQHAGRGRTARRGATKFCFQKIVQ